jgi:aspartate/methionine/tyrosine aminotransferase
MSIGESATLAIMAEAQALRAAGHDVVSLSAGEPDFATVDAIAAAGTRAIREHRTRYTAAAGMPELRQAAARWFDRTYGLRYRPEQLLVTAGAKPALHMALLSLVDRGDRVLLLAPFWVSYPDLIRVADGEPIVLPPVPEQGFVHSGEQIAAAAREHGARGLILNYPNNPSGAVPSRTQMRSIVTAAIGSGLWILSDEIYGSMLYDGLEHVSPAAFPDAADSVLVVNGGTKSHSMTGWRIGFLAGPADLIAAAARIQSQVLGNACTISQHAALELCNGEHGDEAARRMRSFDERRRYLVEQVRTIPGLALAAPGGAFYALVDARPLCARLRCNDIDLAQRLLQQAHLAVVPGTPFAIPGFIRLSFSAPMADLEKAIARLREFARAT